MIHQEILSQILIMFMIIRSKRNLDIQPFDCMTLVWDFVGYELHMLWAKAFSMPNIFLFFPMLSKLLRYNIRG